MISMTFTGPLLEKLSFFTIASAKTDALIQNISGLSQGPVHPFGGRLTVRGRGIHCFATPRKTHHERASRRGEAGLGFRHQVGGAVLDPGPPGHASVDIVPA